ncbi:hypothetical protein A2841_01465 [Candidatus Kaiserbacteria bacterium RIFCSPHIGHO2_01_FULL_48_10]|uniref:Uncharacterized protein n=1 Tax=Candidatus Kaiserbacteria bacterium RIFCSPHIGHO2_01_FULL_48_10 TaxID=1798476 RepID=A0A1F6C1W5_9BACT|nr:MAG: hypothetical protein A2841_01465 [Candidatus Kaiserbacteria bacterium RIFCSPHIGHO2_01_FULL_48_10]
MNVMRRGSTEKLYPKNMLFTRRVIDRITRLRTTTEASSDTEVIRQALLLYEIVVKAIRSGEKLQRLDQEGKITEIELVIGSG